MKGFQRLKAAVSVSTSQTRYGEAAISISVEMTPLSPLALMGWTASVDLHFKGVFVTFRAATDVSQRKEH